MRSFLLTFSLILSFTVSTAAFAGDVHVQGYTRKDGTYVQPHYRSAPDSSRNNNWSTQGNTNPYTGQAGTQPRQPEYGSGLGGNSNNSGSPLFGGNSRGSRFGN